MSGGPDCVPATTGVTYHNVVASVAGLVSIGSVAGADTDDGTDLNGHLLQVQGHTYANVAVTSANVDVYDSTSRQLAIPAVEFNGQLHTNVVVTVGALIAVEGQVN